MKSTIARKCYLCAITGKVIKIGDAYFRLNSRTYGVFHFHGSCTKNDISNYMMNEHVMPAMSEEERATYPRVWDEDEQEITSSMSDEDWR